MNEKISNRQLANRAHAASQLLGPHPTVRLAFNFINFQDYKYKFLADNIRHPTQVFVLEKFVLLSQVFITKHGKRWFFHSHSQLKESLGLDVKTVKKVVDVLVEKKVLLRKKAGRTGTYHYKIRYATLMSHYRSFLSSEILEDKVVRMRLYNERIRYFAYMAKFCKCLKNESKDDKTRTKTVEIEEPKRSFDRVTYSPEVSRFIKAEFGEDYDYEEELDEFDPDDELPLSPPSTIKKSFLPPNASLDDKIACLRSNVPGLSYDEAKKAIKNHEKQTSYKLHNR